MEREHSEWSPELQSLIETGRERERQRLAGLLGLEVDELDDLPEMLAWQADFCRKTHQELRELKESSKGTSDRHEPSDWEGIALAILFVSKPESMTQLYEIMKSQGYPGSRQLLYQMNKLTLAAVSANIYNPRSNKKDYKIRGTKSKSGVVEAWDEADSA